MKKYVNYSKAGKDSVKKYLYLLNKTYKPKIDPDEMFSFKEKDDSEDNDSYIYHEDIFNKTYEKKLTDNDKKEEILDEKKILKIKSTCSSLNKKQNTGNEFLQVRDDIINNKFDLKFDKYKYHLLHHNENYDYIFNKRRIGPSCAKYQPKFEYTYKKLIYSIPFKKMSGRQSQIVIKKIKQDNNNNQRSTGKKIVSSLDKIKQSPIKNSFKIKKEKLRNKNNRYERNTIFDSIISKQSKRKDSSNSINSNNFVFTNNELNFIRKKIKLEKKKNLSKQKEIIKANSMNKFNLNKEKLLEKINLQTPQQQSDSTQIFHLKITNNNDFISNKSSEKNTIKSPLKSEDNNNINQSLNQTVKYKAINFKKMLSREYLNKIKSSKEPIHPMVTPNYSSVEPKTIMKVLYSKTSKKDNNNKMIAYNNDFTYDINEIYNKYNNHHYPKKFNLSKMCGRFENEKNTLPVFMLRSFDRNSIDNLNESSLKMNNYANSTFQDFKSSFKIKQTFNARIKLNELKNENQVMQYNKKFNLKKMLNKKIRYLDEKKEKSDISIIPRNTWWKNRLGEFYKKDYDELSQNFSSSFLGTKVDGITYKIYENKSKYKDLLTKYEKELFSPF
jgi:hypothetical protein